MWVLRSISEAPEDPVTFRLGMASTKTIGRAVRADFILDVPMVSRLHCRLVASRDGQLEVMHLDSTNGTFVNGRRVAKAKLVPGDQLRLGRVELLVTKPEKRRTTKPKPRTPITGSRS